jgi:HAD superfamily hydrolase (TIGR01549 family)
MKALLCDFSQVLLFPQDESYDGSLNKLYQRIKEDGRNFNDFYYLNEELLDYLKDLAVDKYIFTTGTVQNAPEIKEEVEAVFKKVFNVPMIGYEKTDPQAYQEISKRIKTAAEDILFVDDNKNNLQAAETAGVKTRHYKNNHQIRGEIDKWLK